MARVIRAALVQASCPDPTGRDIASIKSGLIEQHLALLEQASRRGAQVCCLQEMFYGPYFAAEQDARWHALGEPVEEDSGFGPTTTLMMDRARSLGMGIIAPIVECPLPGLLYNTAVVIDDRGRYLGKYRKTHLPHCEPGFWEKYYFRPGDLGFPVFDLGFARVGVYICYDRHFPEGARELGLGGAEIVFNPSATVAGLSEHLWKIEQPAHAVANQYFVGAINRVGREKPWDIGEFYGQSYFCDPRGQIVAQASRDRTEVLVADLDLAQIEQVRRVWQFYRDRRPDAYSRR